MSKLNTLTLNKIYISTDGKVNVVLDFKVPQAFFWFNWKMFVTFSFLLQYLNTAKYLTHWSLIDITWTQHWNSLISSVHQNTCDQSTWACSGTSVLNLIKIWAILKLDEYLKVFFSFFFKLSYLKIFFRATDDLLPGLLFDL